MEFYSSKNKELQKHKTELFSPMKKPAPKPKVITEVEVLKMLL